MTQDGQAEALKTVARCEKCGRGYVWVSPDSPMIDTYTVATMTRGERAVCGGKIVLIEDRAR